ncbi:hypothetical protein FHR81_003491 [Actinoalloteichus hoggarensis]|uniref:Uncharacterized protein n=1 Tax=Actinoalloteichus hoggarensis TaxID=1470176 RepID=A0A221W845_9PSEU|nr:hypothetical protein [Actinoalloteichus hoggarensis]ASO21841.1 hypothetical protein AHOG_21125 [Actinoalloteichus hoggarensis]MBB5922439.1 hypothetical protein [Actinoalloteichus hoggarensis]
MSGVAETVGLVTPQRERPAEAARAVIPPRARPTGTARVVIPLRERPAGAAGVVTLLYPRLAATACAVIPLRESSAETADAVIPLRERPSETARAVNPLRERLAENDPFSGGWGRLPVPAAPQRWAGRFRRLEHRRDDTYRSLDVAVCGAALVSVQEWVRLLRCPACFPASEQAGSQADPAPTAAEP